MEYYGLEEVDRAVAAIQGREEQALLMLPNVVGVGVGRKAVAGEPTHQPCLLLLVSQKLPTSELSPGERIPELVEHCKTDVVEVGDLTVSDPAASLPTPPLAQRVRPARGGFSAGHARGVAGSIAGAVVDAETKPGAARRFYLLGSNSAFAAQNEACPGDAILQPSATDGGRTPDDTIGTLARFVPLHFDRTPNRVDAALVEVAFADADPSVFWLGAPLERAARVRIGQSLQKTGRHSLYTTGFVQAVNVTLNVSYGPRKALFCQQILSSPLTAPGDSGSLIFDSARRAVGLALAASARASVLSPIGLVESLLSVRVGF